MLVLAQGPVTKRPGSKFIASAKYTNKKVRLISFEYSTEDAYIIEMGDYYMRFYRDGGQILSAGVPYEIITPFSEDEIFNVQYAQSNNIMYLVCPTDPPQKLTRSGHTNWTISAADIDNGPFQLQNASTTTITPSAATGNITLTASADLFDRDMVGGLFEINQKRGTSTVTGSFTGNGSSSTSAYFTGGYSFTTSGTWVGKLTLERSEDGTNWDNALASLTDTNFDNPSENEDDGAYYRVTMADYASGTCKYVFTIFDELNHGVVKITGYTSPVTVSANVITDLEGTTATSRWREGYWSDYRGWPQTVEFHQQRLIFGGNKTFPQTLWFGEENPDNYEDFLEGTLDTSAFIIALQGQNPIRWMVSQNVLMIGTAGSIGVYGENGKVITPTTPAYKENSKVGSSPIRAIIAGDELLYIERGNKKVREMIYSLQYDKYVSPDLTILAEDIAKQKIKDAAFQSRPNPILWCVLENGDAATLTYYKDQEVVAWASQTTDGLYKSFSVIPSEDEDEVWCVVERTVNGATKTFIEQIQPIYWGDNDNLCFFLDCGLSYSGSATNTFSGLGHLAGNNVSVYADGILLSTETVTSAGVVTIDNQASDVVIGLPFTAKLETMPIVIDPQDRSMNKKINFIAFDLYKSGQFKYGNGANSALIDVYMYEDSTVTASQGLYTSEQAFKRVSFPYGSMKKQTVYVESANPVPLTIRAIIPEYSIVP